MGLAKPLPTDGTCGGLTRAGTPCQLRAGQGTDHVGYARCKLHGGNNPPGRKRAQRLIAQDQVATLGLPREIDPHDALLEEVHRTAGHVAWLHRLVGQLDEHAAITDPGSVWVKLYGEERDRLVRVGRAAIDAGVAERTVRLAEAQAQRLADVIARIVADLGHDLADERTRRVVGRGLRLVESN